MYIKNIHQEQLHVSLIRLYPLCIENDCLKALKILDDLSMFQLYDASTIKMAFDSFGSELYNALKK